jgi:capsular polysaccharide biosynthesis protein
MYSSDTTLYVGRNIEGDSATTYNDLLLGDRLVADYRELVKSRRITSVTLQELGLDDMSSAKLVSRVKVESKSNTRIITITVEDEDPQTAMNVANKIAQIFKDEVIEIMEVQNVQIIDEAVLNSSPVKPNIRLNTAIGFVLGLMLSIFIVFLIEYLDTSIKNPEDIKKYLDLPVLGVIPKFE